MSTARAEAISGSPNAGFVHHPGGEYQGMDAVFRVRDGVSSLVSAPEDRSSIAARTRNWALQVRVVPGADGQLKGVVEAPATRASVARSSRCLQEYYQHDEMFAITEDGAFVVHGACTVQTPGGFQLEVHSATTGALVHATEFPEACGSWNRNGVIAMVPGGARVLIGLPSTDAIVLFDAARGIELKRAHHTVPSNTPTEPGTVFGLAVSPDATSSFSVGADGALRRWRLPDLAPELAAVPEASPLSTGMYTPPTGTAVPWL